MGLFYTDDEILCKRVEYGVRGVVCDCLRCGECYNISGIKCIMRSCYNCKWVKDILKNSNLSDDIIKKVEYTAEKLANDQFKIGKRYSEDPETDDYVRALALHNYAVDIYKENIQ